MNQNKALGLTSGKGETMEVKNIISTQDTTKAHWSAV
jgi:hypothetical protein